MKNLFKVLGIIAMIAVIGLALSCEVEPEDQTVITITGIADTYNGKSACINVVKTGSTDILGYSRYITIRSGEVELALYNKDGEAVTVDAGRIVLEIYENKDDDDYLYSGSTDPISLGKGSFEVKASKFEPDLTTSSNNNNNNNNNDAPVPQAVIGTYSCTYVYGWDSTLNGYKSVIETISFGGNTFDISDNYNGSNANDHLHFFITDWEDFAVPTSPAGAVPPAGYTTGKRFKGKIISQSGYVPSNYTAPGFTAADVKADKTGPDCYMYLYFKPDGSFVRTTFTKTAGTVTNIVNGYNITAGNQGYNIPREYTK